MTLRKMNLRPNDMSPPEFHLAKVKEMHNGRESMHSARMEVMVRRRSSSRVLRNFGTILFCDDIRREWFVRIC